MPLKDMHESCEQCGFLYARVDTEAWDNNSARRLMCPVCGWTAYEELSWDNGEPVLVKRSNAKGYGAFRLIPPGGYCGYNAFHEPPALGVLAILKDILSTHGWKGYISIWSERDSKAFLIFGSPLDKFGIMPNDKNDDAGDEKSGTAFSSVTESFNWSGHSLIDLPNNYECSGGKSGEYT